ncbi:MAG: carboxypeptidase-like regulatory domain-containing protein [Candidatus Poribacteria bacterium]|nr:carboxypeptidase-like regulatory domain-containing protein [Candidatus Poribacteria bacterium]MDE0503513.1 carboxypeptidase-like regulatory domain-containing protein [Candidatus Poribacteria bacterium]
MKQHAFNSVVAIYVLLLVGCAEERETRQVFPPSAIAGSIRGNISPISVYDAKVEVLYEGNVVAAVGVQDGVFLIEDLTPGHYNLRVSAFGYVTNNAIREIEVAEGKVTEVGRAVIFPQNTGKYVPTRIMGTVSDSVTRAPIVGAVIRVKCNEAICNTLESASDSNGQFEIAVWSNLTSIVTATKQGYRTAHAEVKGIPTGKSASIALELMRLEDQ